MLNARLYLVFLFLFPLYGQITIPTSGTSVTITFLPCSVPVIPPTGPVDYAAECLPASTGLPALSGPVLPILPQSCPHIVYPVPTTTVSAGSTFASLQSAVNAASVACDTKIVLTAGTVYTGNLIIPGSNCLAKPNLLESSNIAALTARQYPDASLSGTAAVPTLMGVGQISGSTAALTVKDSANGWYFAGLEITLTPAAKFVYPIVGMGESATTVAALPQNITFDRMLVHPAPCVNDTMAAKCTYVARGIDLGAVNGGILYSNIYGIVNSGQDAAAIVVMNTTGPGLIAGNRLEGTGMSIMFNTECTFPTTTGNAPNGVPWGAQGFTTGDIGMTTCPAAADFTVRLNHSVKQLAWQTRPTGCDPNLFQCYDVKNHFEVKHGQRILFDSNILDTTYASGQAGFFISNCFAAGLYICQDLTFTNNLIMHGPNIGSVSGNGWPVSGGTAITTGTRTLVRNNLALDIDGIKYGGPACLQVAPYTHCAGGTTFQTQHSYNYTIDHNTSINRPSQYFNSLIFTDYPPSTDFGYQLTNNLQFGTPFANANTPGGTIAALPTPVLGGDYFVGDYWGYPTIFSITNLPVYPAGVHSLSSSAVSIAGSPPVTCQNNNNVMLTCWPLDWALVGFVDFSGASNGTNPAGAALDSGSAYKGVGTDGRDIGANVTAVLAAVSSIR